MEQVLEDRIRAELADNLVRTGPPPGGRTVPPIPTGRYTDRRLGSIERDRIWKRSWLFAGHESDLAEPGAYRLFDRTGSPLIVVRGHDGVIRAFHNSCRHRGAPVVRDECGVAKRLTCQYHSWSYDTVGDLRAVPDRRNFVDLDESTLGLLPARCESVDGWVFVNEDLGAPSLVDALGPLVEQMAEIDGRSLRRVGTQHHRIECNWKLLVDAFLEVYHVRTIHPDNAALLYDDRTVTVAMLPNGHSRLTVGKRPELVDLVVPPPEADNPSVGTLWRETSTSFGIFPNLVVPMDTGAFTWLCMWPIDDQTTDLELQWFAPDWGDAEMPADNAARMLLFETVMAQDTANMAAIQRSVASGATSHFHIGWHERLIHHFHRSLDLAMGEAMPPELAVSADFDDLVER